MEIIYGILKLLAILFAISFALQNVTFAIKFSFDEFKANIKGCKGASGILSVALIVVLFAPALLALIIKDIYLKVNRENYERLKKII